MGSSLVMDTPYVFQKADDVPAEWRDKACAIACVKMIVDHMQPARTASMEALINEGVALEGFGERGWKHEALIQVLGAHGVAAHREEFRDPDAERERLKREEGFVKILNSVGQGKPVMVSIRKTNGSFHLLLVVGKTQDGYIVHDPEIGPSIELSQNDFAAMWRGLAIFVD